MAASALKERPAAKTARKKRTFVAKPVRGKIDFKALRQGIIDRFPKTIAYLAK
jgi:hypothetical protein